MTQKQTLTGLILLVVASLLVAGCSPQQAAAPTATVDTAMIITQAAQTVQAGMALTEAAQPPTVAPTSTTAPTNTMDPVMALALTQTSQAVQPGAATTPGTPAAGTPAAPAAGQPTATNTPLVAIPTATSAVVAPAPKTTGDKAELVDQSPEDNSSVPKKATFNAHITLKNTGTTTWTTKYALVFYAGDKMGSPNDYYFPNEVKPGETVKLIFEMKASDSTGKKKTIWAVRNADGVNFYSLWLEMNVTD